MTAMSQLTCILWGIFILWVCYDFIKIRMQRISPMSWLRYTFFMRIKISRILLRNPLCYLWWWTRYRIIIRIIPSIPLYRCLLYVSPSYIRDFLYRLQLIILSRLVMLVMFNLILRPCGILCLWWFKHYGTFRKCHLRRVLPIMCPPVLLNLLNFINLWLSVIDRLHFQGVISSHGRGVCLVKLLWGTHYEVVCRWVHGFNYEIVTLVFFIEGVVPWRGDLLEALVCQGLRGLWLNFNTLFGLRFGYFNRHHHRFKLFKRYLLIIFKCRLDHL